MMHVLFIIWHTNLQIIILISKHIRCIAVISHTIHNVTEIFRLTYVGPRKHVLDMVKVGRIQLLL